MMQTPDKGKLLAAMNNPKCSDRDKATLIEAQRAYESWVAQMNKVTSTGKDRVVELTKLLNQYKDQIRHAKRLTFGKRTEYSEVRRQHRECPIDAEIIWKFTSELQNFVKSVWYDPDKALERGSFI
jgi:hypothetical protein